MNNKAFKKLLVISDNNNYELFNINDIDKNFVSKKYEELFAKGIKKVVFHSITITNSLTVENKI